MQFLLQAARPAALMPAPFPQLHPAVDGASLLLTIAISAILAGLIFSVLAVVLYARLVHARRTARFELDRIAGQIAFRDALLATGGERVVVLSDEARQPWDSDAGNVLLKAAMTGPDSLRVAAALGGLIREGKAFGLVARGMAAGDSIAIRGDWAQPDMRINRSVGGKTRSNSPRFLRRREVRRTTSYVPKLSYTFGPPCFASRALSRFL